MFAQTIDLEMAYVKESVFEVSGGDAKDHPAMQELFKTRIGELQSPLLCLLLINDSQCFPFCIQKEMLDGVLFETFYSEKNNKESVLTAAAMREPAQPAFALLLGECLHAM